MISCLLFSFSLSGSPNNYIKKRAHFYFEPRVQLQLLLPQKGAHFFHCQSHTNLYSFSLCYICYIYFITDLTKLIFSFSFLNFPSMVCYFLLITSPEIVVLFNTQDYRLGKTLSSTDLKFRLSLIILQRLTLENVNC